MLVVFKIYLVFYGNVKEKIIEEDSQLTLVMASTPVFEAE